MVKCAGGKTVSFLRPSCECIYTKSNALSRFAISLNDDNINVTVVKLSVPTSTDIYNKDNLVAITKKLFGPLLYVAVLPEIHIKRKCSFEYESILADFKDFEIVHSRETKSFISITLKHVAPSFLLNYIDARGGVGISVKHNENTSAQPNGNPSRTVTIKIDQKKMKEMTEMEKNERRRHLRKYFEHKFGLQWRVVPKVKQWHLTLNYNITKKRAADGRWYRSIHPSQKQKLTV